MTRKPRFALGSQKTYEMFTLAGRKQANKYTPADPAVVNAKSRERADKTRACGSTFHEDRLRAKYLIIKFGRERAVELLDMRAELLGR